MIRDSGIIYNALPEKIKNNIIDTTVVSGHGNNDDENHISTDKVYLLSAKEVYGKVEYDTAAEKTRQLDYYEIEEVTTSSYDDAVKLYNGGGTSWWLHSPISNDPTLFYDVQMDGHDNGNSASNPDGVAPAFRLG